jgi:large subunit ribosomal protein L29
VKPEELRVLEVDELIGRLKSSRRELYELRFKLAVGQLDDHRQIRKVRQDIARILTFKRQRELGLVVDDQAELAVAAAPAATKPAESKAEPAAARGDVPPQQEAEAKEEE